MPACVNSLVQELSAAHARLLESEAEEAAARQVRWLACQGVFTVLGPCYIRDAT